MQLVDLPVLDQELLRAFLLASDDTVTHPTLRIAWFALVAAGPDAEVSAVAAYSVTSHRKARHALARLRTLGWAAYLGEGRWIAKDARS